MPARWTLSGSPEIKGCQSGSGCPSPNNLYAQVEGNHASRWTAFGFSLTHYGTKSHRLA